jgi:hypothetical protein
MQLMENWNDMRKQKRRCIDLSLGVLGLPRTPLPQDDSGRIGNNNGISCNYVMQWSVHTYRRA